MSTSTVIDKVLHDVEVESYKVKKQESLTLEERTNKFLDAILTLGEAIEERTGKLNRFSEKFEELTWFNEVDEEFLMQINKLIASSRDLHLFLIKDYISLEKSCRQAAVLKRELKDYKVALDTFKEMFLDLEIIFFNLRNDSEFNEITKSLCDL